MTTDNLDRLEIVVYAAGFLLDATERRREHGDNGGTQRTTETTEAIGGVCGGGEFVLARTIRKAVGDHWPTVTDDDE